MHVIDASRVVGVVSKLLDPVRKAELDATNRVDQDRLRALHAERERTPLLPYRKALEHRTPIEWRADDVSPPPFTGVQVVEPSLEALRALIDWTFFFTAWELKGRYPQILDHPAQGAAARELFEHGNELLDTIVADGSIQARGVYGFWPAHTEADDIVLADGTVFPMLRQQVAHGDDDDRPNRSLADFVAPHDSGLADHLGGFAVTAGIGADELAKTFEADLDDYRAIMVKALADRLAEAFAEWLHREVRRAWYAPEESLEPDGPHRGALPGHPARVRLPGLPRPHREAHAVRSARRSRPRHGPHLVVRDDARRDRRRPVLRPPAGALLQRRAASARTRSRTTPGARGRASPRRNAGCARTSPTTPTDRRPQAATAWRRGALPADLVHPDRLGAAGSVDA